MSEQTAEVKTWSGLRTANDSCTSNTERLDGFRFRNLFALRYYGQQVDDRAFGAQRGDQLCRRLPGTIVG
ncbi:MAG: hypothetical protein WBN29_17275, partial [Polyangiales bacterium]